MCYFRSSQIADLQVMGKANEIQANLKSAYSQSEAVKSQDTSITEDADEGSKTSLRKSMSQPAVLGKSLNTNVSNGGSTSVGVNGTIQFILTYPLESSFDGQDSRHFIILIFFALLMKLPF